MAILGYGIKKTIRTEPLVWVSRIDLYESLDPPTLIRESIKLVTGINIVWGIEDETETDTLEPGHGVGKTTLCRLIRYCLGESSYGQNHAVKEIHHTFPDGFVAVEVHINGQRWAVLRPFAKQRADCAQANATIEKLIQDRPAKASFNTYCKILEAACLKGIRSDSVLPGGASLQWGHLLAMCTRDQEARYQSLWQWRSPRSDSGPPNIQKDDAYRTLRSVLGLLPDAESKLQHKLLDITTEQSDLKLKIAERQKEPDYWARNLRRRLRDEFDISEAMTASLNEGELFSLPRLIELQINRLETKQTDRDIELISLGRQINLASIALQEPAELQAQEQAAVANSDDGTCVLLESIKELRELEIGIKEAGLSICRYGQISIGDCSYALQQLTKLGDQIRDTQKSTLPTTAGREQAAAAIKSKIERRAKMLEKLQGALDKLLKQQQKLNDQRLATDRQIIDLESILARIVEWENLRDGNTDDSELAKLVKRQNKIDKEEQAAKQKLTDLIKEQDQLADGLRAVFESLIRTTLSKEFRGRISLTRDGIEFRIFRGENLSGEAFETLSILIADLTVLVMGAIGAAQHPGLLMHDSPREADLGG
ncbi:MAG TPA: hypothetical protein DCM07_18520, partial [Planctomycetaceae bacterium]|nr:hypothetical protein [Planctomycetaceae bacterium]